MKKVSAVLLLFFLSGCIVHPYIMKNKPDIASVTLNTDAQYEGELIAIVDSSILLNVLTDSVKGHAYLVPFRQIKLLRVGGFSDKTWIYHVLLTQGFPAIVLGITAGAAGSDGTLVAGFFGVSFALSSLFYLISDRTPEFKGEEIILSPLIVRPYTFYPGGIPEAQLLALMKRNNQDTLSIL